MLNTKELYLRTASGAWHWPVVRHVAIGFMRQILHEKEINTFLNTHGHLSAKEFIEQVLEYLGTQYQVTLCHQAQLPMSGRCVIVANHPLGGLDGLILLHALLTVRSDVRIVAYQLLSQIKPISQHIIPVDNWSDDYVRSRLKVIKSCLEQEMAVIFFPAAEVSRLHKGIIQDKDWSKGAYILAKQADAPIVPVYVEGENSQLFYQTSKLMPFFSRYLLAREMWQQKQKSVNVHVGQPLKISMLSSLPIEDKQIMDLLRSHVYQLKEPQQGVFHSPQQLAQPLDLQMVRRGLERTSMLGKINDDCKILLYKTHDNVALLQEIGRLREYTFRKVGEGSGSARDLDSYDSYYHHLLVWHEQKQSIMGAYRVLPTNKLVAQRGVDILYTARMFHFNNDKQWLNEAMELGRGFICPEFWNSSALDIMWQGIGAYITRLDNIRYLFGSVSISSTYPREAVDWLVAYYRHYFSNGAQLVKAKNPYVINRTKQKQFDEIFAQMTYLEAQKELKKRLKTMGLAIPTLFKHYAALCEYGGVNFMDFGVDPEFGFSIDGFVVVDLNKIVDKKRQRYIEPFAKKIDVPIRIGNLAELKVDVIEKA